MSASADADHLGLAEEDLETWQKGLARRTWLTLPIWSVGPTSGLRRPTFRDLSVGSFDMRTIRSNAWRCEAEKALGCRAMTA